MQYLALGIPTITSPVGVNRQIITDGENGFLASSEPEWIDKLSRLLSDAALRWRFANAGCRVVEERYAARVQAPRLLDVLLQACGHRRHAAAALAEPVAERSAATAVSHHEFQE